MQTNIYRETFIHTHTNTDEQINIKFLIKKLIMLNEK